MEMRQIIITATFFDIGLPCFSPLLRYFLSLALMAMVLCAVLALEIDEAGVSADVVVLDRGGDGSSG